MLKTVRVFERSGVGQFGDAVNARTFELPNAFRPLVLAELDEAVELVQGGPAVNRVLRYRDACGDVLGLAAGRDGRSRVQDHDVPFGAALALEDAADDLGVVRRASPWRSAMHARARPKSSGRTV